MNSDALATIAASMISSFEAFGFPSAILLLTLSLNKIESWVTIPVSS